MRKLLKNETLKVLCNQNETNIFLNQPVKDITKKLLFTATEEF
jgi:hypothetical protein